MNNIVKKQNIVRTEVITKNTNFICKTPALKMFTPYECVNAPDLKEINRT
jgi:hypothetical protein